MNKKNIDGREIRVLGAEEDEVYTINNMPLCDIKLREQLANLASYFEVEQTSVSIKLKYQDSVILEIPLNIGGGGGSQTPPAFEITLSATPSVVEIGHPTTVTLKWAYSGNIASQHLNDDLLPSTLRTLTYAPASTTTYTLAAVPEGGEGTIFKNVTVNVVGATYYGVVNGLNVTSDEITSLNKVIKVSKGYNYQGINLSGQKVCYAYPSSFGRLTSIKDANGFEYIDSYTLKTMIINNLDYNVYILTDSTSITNLKQTFV